MEQLVTDVTCVQGPCGHLKVAKQVVENFPACDRYKVVHVHYWFIGNLPLIMGLPTLILGALFKKTVSETDISFFFDKCI